MSHVFKTQVLLDVTLKYDILPEEDDLPEQIDVLDAWLTITNPETGKTRKVHMLHAISESDLITIEDEIHGDIT